MPSSVSSLRTVCLEYTQVIWKYFVCSKSFILSYLQVLYMLTFIPPIPFPFLTHSLTLSHHEGISTGISSAMKCSLFLYSLILCFLSFSPLSSYLKLLFLYCLYVYKGRGHGCTYGIWWISINVC